MNAWETILLAVGGNAALLAVLGLVGKSLLDKLILRDTQKFEADIKAKSEAAIEHLRSELQLRATEHSVRFSRLHEKRATVIAELYGHLIEALWEAESFLSLAEWSGEPSKKEKHRIAMQKLVELYRYFGKHRIYLPHELCESLEKLVNEVHALVINFGVYLDFDKGELNERTAQEKHAAWLAGWKAIKNEVPSGRRALEDEFRVLLGDTLPTAPTTPGTTLNVT